ncbi:venom dipeptidyl peptidase 4-like [Bacillus rossius redtenbacheri]|uniref:venom dipeptidyl peptidase 4-like n=1 Tax=Bacillus rossius redtenbacheri TaxID=93214 RepID=UPI002FDD9FDB
MALLSRRGAMSAALLLCYLAAVVEPRATSLKQAQETKKPYTLEEITGRVFTARGFNGTWISGSEFYFTSGSTGDIYRYDVSEDSTSLLLAHDILEARSASLQSVSADGKNFLLSYGRKPGFRHSSLSSFVVYNNETRELYPVGGGQPLSLAQWGPAGSALAFVRGNDLHYKPSYDGAEVRLTSSGVEGVVYNGVADWVYEEEVLATSSALWFSPGGSSLAYVTFNDSHVKEMTYDVYGTPGSLGGQYPELVSLRYPKAGSPNPSVSLRVIGLQGLTAQDAVGPEVLLPAPVDVVSDDHIIFSVTWATEKKVVAVWTNRRQNESATTAYDLGDDLSLSSVSQLHHKIEPQGWVSPAALQFDPSGGSYVTVLSQPQGGQLGDFNHVTLVRDGVETPLTSGAYVVVSVYGWDAATGNIYFLATGRNSSTQRHVYAVSQDGSSDTCLSCSVRTPEGNPCAYASASFSKDFSHYALVCSGPDPAFAEVYKATGLDAQPLLWEDNEAYRRNVSSRSYPELYTTQVPVDGGFTATARLWLPPGLDRSGATKYPLLVFVYGGPGSKQITDAFTLSFGTYLATNRSVIYGLVDGRGSGLRGNKLLFQLNNRLGTVEIQDQISVTRFLQETLPYVDAERTGIWGWSYGGYATAMALARDTGGVFQCGASVAPVTSWIYYDSIYTERFMGLPTAEDNAAGYDEADVNRRAENFRDKGFLLLHGTADDNVHYQHSMALSRSLELKDILFSEVSYPDENHSIGTFPFHVYLTMDNFWKKCFK